MITYKGDRFVKGKQFMYESNVLKFITKSKTGFIFESAENKKVVLSESVAKNLKEVCICQKKNH